MKQTADSPNLSPTSDRTSKVREVLWKLLKLLAQDVARNLSDSSGKQNRPSVAPQLPTDSSDGDRHRTDVREANHAN
jgi:hypothetical protein